jgi:hypothetical protein
LALQHNTSQAFITRRWDVCLDDHKHSSPEDGMYAWVMYPNWQSTKIGRMAEQIAEQIAVAKDEGMQCGKFARRELL